MGFFKKIKEGLKKTRDAVVGQIDSMLKSFTKIDDELFEELEELLVMGDVGVPTAEKICKELRERVKKEGIKDPSEITSLLKEIIADMLRGGEELDLATSPSIILVIGVNGVGKTTTIGKLAWKMIQEGKKVLLVAGDTFRAGATKQLEEWANKIGADFYGKEEGSDPASVVYDGLEIAKNENYDVVFIDTAGRLQNKVNLMKELEKVNRVIDTQIPGAPHETLLVIDATTGQNGISQAKSFKEITNITGIVLTKLDGTAKGGIVLAIKEEVNIPVKYIGLGERKEDLQVFDIENYIYGLFKDMM